LWFGGLAAFSTRTDIIVWLLAAFPVCHTASAGPPSKDVETVKIGPTEHEDSSELSNFVHRRIRIVAGGRRSSSNSRATARRP
jgi:hypothetical protein